MLFALVVVLVVVWVLSLLLLLLLLVLVLVMMMVLFVVRFRVFVKCTQQIVSVGVVASFCSLVVVDYQNLVRTYRCCRLLCIHFPASLTTLHAFR